MAPKRARAASPAPADKPDKPETPVVSVAERARAAHARVATFVFDEPSVVAGVSCAFLQRYKTDFGVAGTDVAASHVAEYLKFMAIKAALQLAAEEEARKENNGGAGDAATAPAATAPSGATPSLAVDGVWHTHLAFSRSYARLCAALLTEDSAAAASTAASTATPPFLHHDPSPGGAAAEALFRAQYDATRAVYTNAFGAPPPQAVWPAPGVRFAPQSQWCAVTRGDRELLRLLSARENERAARAEYDSGADFDSGGCG